MTNFPPFPTSAHTIPVDTAIETQQAKEWERILTRQTNQILVYTQAFLKTENYSLWKGKERYVAIINFAIRVTKTSPLFKYLLSAYICKHHQWRIQRGAQQAAPPPRLVLIDYVFNPFSIRMRQNKAQIP